MLLTHAHAICSTKDSYVAWDVMRDNHASFLWTDDEELPSTWNRLYGSEAEQRCVKEVWDDNEALQYVYGLRTQSVQLQRDRIDKTICMHALAQLVQLDIEIRYCRDSDHSSNMAYLGLSPDEWTMLERQYGAEIVAKRFLKLAPNFDDFTNDQIRASNEEPDPLDPSLTDWIGGATYKPHKLNYLIVSEAPGTIRRETLEYIIGRNLEPGLFNVSTFGSSESKTMNRKELFNWIPKHVGTKQLRVWDRAAQGFVIIEQRSVAAGWRTDGRFLNPKPRWKFWG